MDWPSELLEIFNDPLLDGVRPKVTPVTADDRMGQKLEEVRNWIAGHGREPGQNGDLKEKMMWAAMTALRKKGLMNL